MDTAGSSMGPGVPWHQVQPFRLAYLPSPSSMPLRYPYGFWWQPRSLTSTLPLMVTQVPDIDTDCSCSRTRNPDMALEGSLAQNHGFFTYPSSSLPSSPQVHLSPQCINPSAWFPPPSLPHSPSFPSPHHTFIHQSGTHGRCLGLFLPASPNTF